MLTEKQRKILKIIAVILVKKIIRKKRLGRRPDTDSALKGFAYVQEILNGNLAHFLEILRMNKQAFLRICEHFKNKTWLKDSRYIKVEEKMAMFLMTLNHNVRNRVTKRRFNHSTQTIHYYFHEVLEAMLLFRREMIVPTSVTEVTENHPHQRLREVFKVKNKYKFIIIVVLVVVIIIVILIFFLINRVLLVHLMGRLFIL